MKGFNANMLERKRVSLLYLDVAPLVNLLRLVQKRFLVIGAI